MELKEWLDRIEAAQSVGPLGSEARHMTGEVLEAFAAEERQRVVEHPDIVSTICLLRSIVTRAALPRDSNYTLMKIVRNLQQWQRAIR